MLVIFTFLLTVVVHLHRSNVAVTKQLDELLTPRILIVSSSIDFAQLVQNSERREKSYNISVLLYENSFVFLVYLADTCVKQIGFITHLRSSGVCLEDLRKSFLLDVTLCLVFGKG